MERLLGSDFNEIGWFESYLIEIPKDTFSHDAAHIEVNFSLFSWPRFPSAQVPELPDRKHGC